MAIQPLPIAPDLLAGNWVGEDETEWLTAAQRALGAGQQAGDDGATLTTTAAGVDDTLNGQTGTAAVGNLRDAARTKTGLAGQYGTIGAIYQQAGLNVTAAKNAQNGILGAFQTAQNANAAAAVAGNWGAPRVAAENLRLRQQTRTALAGVNGQFKTAQNSLLADMQAKRQPGTQSKMPGSENNAPAGGGDGATTGTGAGGGVAALGAGGAGGTGAGSGGVENVLSSLLGTGTTGANGMGSSNAMMLMQTFMPIAMGLLSTGLGLVTSGVSALTGSSGAAGAGMTGSPYGSFGSTGSLGATGLGGTTGLAGTTGLGGTGAVGSPLSGLLGQSGSGAPTAGIPGTPSTTGAPATMPSKPKDPISTAIKDAETRVNDFLGGKDRLGLVHDNGDGTHRVQTVGLDGKTRTETLDTPRETTAAASSSEPTTPGHPGSGGTPGPNSHTTSAASTPPAANPPAGGQGDSGSGNGGDSGSGGAPATGSPDGGTPQTMPAANDTPTTAPAPVDHPTTDPGGQQYASNGVPSTLSSFDPRHTTALPTFPTSADPVHVPTHQVGTGLSSAAPAGPISPVDPTGGAHAAAPAAAAPATPMTPPMAPMGGGGMAPSAPAASGPVAAPAGGAHPVQAPSVSMPDTPATHGPISPVRGDSVTAFPATGPAGYLAMLPQPKALAHTKLAAIAASQDGVKSWQPAAIGVFERDRVLTFVYASVDGLGFIPEGVELPAGVRTLSELAMGDPGFFAQWGGYRDPVPKLRAFEYSPANLVGQLVAAVAMDTAEEISIQTREQKEAIAEAKLLAPLSVGRKDFGSTFSIGQLADALRNEYTNLPEEYKYSPAQAHTELIAARWGDDDGHSLYPWVWRAYLIISARAAIETGDYASAKYLVAEIRRSGPVRR